MKSVLAIAVVVTACRTSVASMDYAPPMPSAVEPPVANDDAAIGIADPTLAAIVRDHWAFVAA